MGNWWSDPTLEVYHYTTQENLWQIQRSGYIRESPLSNKDAFFGAGVYLTTLTPQEGRKRIADNNWGRNLGHSMEEMGKVDRAIKLWIPGNKLKRARSGDREIWVHQEDITLSLYSHSFHRLDQGDSWCAIL